MGPVAAPGKGPDPAREGRGRGGPGGPQAPSAAGGPVGSLVTWALPSVGSSRPMAPGHNAAGEGLNRRNHMPLSPMVPAGTGRDRDFPLRRGRKGGGK